MFTFLPSGPRPTFSAFLALAGFAFGMVSFLRTERVLGLEGHVRLNPSSDHRRYLHSLRSEP